MGKYGVNFGLTNYAAAYCTGLLCARRALAKLQLEQQFIGKVEADGQPFIPEEDGESRPFKAILDVGLRRTTTGARIFAAMKGACDGGVLVPHSENRFAGYEVLRKYIYGGHVAEYMQSLKDETPEKYQAQFSQYVKLGIEPSKLEEIYTKAHQAIRADPSHVKKETKKSQESKKFRMVKLTLEQRQAKIAQRKAEFQEKLESLAQE